MKIVKIGTFNEMGHPIGWHMDCTNFDSKKNSDGIAITDSIFNKHCLGISNSEDPNLSL